MAFIPDDFPKFTHPDSETIKHLMEKFPQYLHNISAVLGIKNSREINACQETLYEIMIRVEQRRVYFHVFHNGLKMGEINEGALLCFWILKLTPFRHDNIPNSLLNTKIAITLFINMLYFVAAKTNKKVNIKSELLKNTLYAFRYRDLSKEAIMALADSFLFIK